MNVAVDADDLAALIEILHRFTDDDWPDLERAETDVPKCSCGYQQRSVLNPRRVSPLLRGTWKAHQQAMVAAALGGDLVVALGGYR